MSEVVIAAAVSLALLITILIAYLAALYGHNKRVEKDQYGTVVSYGTEARKFYFTGRLVATYTNEFHKKSKLYETPSGMYRVVHTNGNVSFKKSDDEIAKEYTALAKKAGIVRHVHLDHEEDKLTRNCGGVSIT